jgi:hypothetical protein
VDSTKAVHMELRLITISKSANILEQKNVASFDVPNVPTELLI